MKKSSIQQELREIALHESAHSAVAYLCGKVLLGATIEGKAYFEKQPVHYYEAGYCGNERLDDKNFSDALIYAAPAWIEEKLLGKISQGSLQNCREVISCILPENQKITPIANAARAAINKTSNKKRQEVLFYKILKPYLSEILSEPKAETAIVALANALFEHGTLNGRECASILEKSFGSLPKGALPLNCHAIRPAAKTKIGRYGHAAKLLNDILHELEMGDEGILEEKLRLRLLEARLLAEALST